LIYIPRDQSEITLVERNGVSPADQWAALDAFISGNEYLNSRRGQYAERNGDDGVRSDIVDLKFIQDFSVKTGNNKNTLQLSLDIFNFTNLLNKDWGQKRFVGSFGNVGLIRTETAGPNPEFSFDPSLPERLVQLDDRGIQSSRWQAQFGIRYIFN
jgi:hypothetical protein